MWAMEMVLPHRELEMEGYAMLLQHYRVIRQGVGCLWSVRGH